MKIIKTGTEARKLLKQGIDKVADAVKLTLGPSGRNAIIGKKFESPLITNDGVSVAKAFELEDEIENLGAEKVKEVGTLTDGSVGDGTTTATVLLQAIMNAGFERLSDDGSLVAKTTDPILIKKEIDEACIKVVSELKKMAKPITTRDEIEKVAFVSVENKEIAKIVADLFEKIGKDGIVTIEDGSFDVEAEVVEGMEIGAGISSPYMANTDSRELILYNTPILVSNEQFSHPDQFKGLTSKLIENGIKSLVIVGEGFTKEILDAAVVTKIKSNFTILCLKPPYWTNKDRLEDIAIKFGAYFFDKDKNVTSQSAELKHIGSIAKVISNKDKTLLIGGKGDVSLRVKELTNEIKKTKGQFEKKKLEERVASLTGGIGVIRVGAQSDSERDYWKLKVQDVIGATKAALEEGVVKGGGLAYKAISEKLPENILTKALLVPYEQIQKNAGVALEIGDDIIDPVKVTRIALQNACSLAGIVLTTEVAIAIKNEPIKREDK